MHYFWTNKYRVWFTTSSSLIFGLISCITFKYAWSVHWISNLSRCLVSDWHMVSLVSALSFMCLHYFNIIFLYNWKDSLWCHFACSQLLTSLFYGKGIEKGMQIWHSRILDLETGLLFAFSSPNHLTDLRAFSDCYLDVPMETHKTALSTPAPEWLPCFFEDNKRKTFDWSLSKMVKGLFWLWNYM